MSAELPSNNLREQVRQALLRERSQDSDGTAASALKLIVGVSGGEDSVALLHLLCSIREEQKLELVVAHVNHGLRAESAFESQFVEHVCSTLNVPCLTYRAPVRPERTNIEAWAREIRYAFFNECLNENRADFIVTAHHANDQAETVLFRLLTGRMATSSRNIEKSSLLRKVLRPLLGVSKAEIEAYALEHQLQFVVDQSNLDPARTRSRIRAELLPLAANVFGPSVVSTVGVVAQKLADDEQFLWAEAERIVASRDSIDLFELLLLPAALQWRSIQLVARFGVGEAAEKLGYLSITSLLKKLSQPETKLVGLNTDLGFGVRLVIQDSKLSFKLVDSARRAKSGKHRGEAFGQETSISDRK